MAEPRYGSDRPIPRGAPQPAPEEPLTLEQFERLPEEDAYRVELVRGHVVREPRPAPLHGRIVARLAHFLEDHVERHGGGIVFADAGFVTEEDPPSVRGPDIAFVAHANVPESGWGQSFWHIGPDLAVEVLSPSDRPREMRRKVHEYLAAGTRMVWIVDPARRTVTVHEPSGSVQEIAPDGTLHAPAVLPAFSLPLPRLFDLG